MEERILELLSEEYPEIDFESSDALVDDGILDSLTITGIIATLTMEFGITIPYEEIIEENFNSVQGLAAMVEEKQPEKVAVAFKNETLTYKQLCERICGMAAFLKENGVEKKDRVCFMALSKPEMVVTYLGIQMIGAVPVFLDKNSTAENIALVYGSSEASLLLCDKPLKDAAKGLNVKSLKKFYEASAEASKDKISKIKEEYAVPEEDELAEILFTTGSTGTPKGVKLSYKSVHNIYMNTIEGIGISEDEIMLLPLPLNHSFALRVLRATLYQGATVILQNGFTFAKAVEDNIEKFNCTAMACVPASYEVMKSQMQDAFSLVLSKLKYIEFGAGSYFQMYIFTIRGEVQNLVEQSSAM